MKLRLAHKFQAALMAALASVSITTLSSGTIAVATGAVLLASQTYGRDLTQDTTTADGVTYNGYVFNMLLDKTNAFGARNFYQSTYDEASGTWTNIGSMYTSSSTAITTPYGKGAFWTMYSSNPKPPSVTALPYYGTTLRLSGSTSSTTEGKRKLETNFDGFTIGGLIADDEWGDTQYTAPAYWFYRNGSMDIDGYNAVNMDINSYVRFSYGGYRGSVNMKKGGTWNIHSGKTLEFDNNPNNAITFNFYEGQALTVTGGGTLNLGRSSNGAYNVTMQAGSSLHVTGTDTTVGIQADSGTFTANGAITVDEGSTLSIGLNTTLGRTITNAGTLTVASGKTVTLTSDLSGFDYEAAFTDYETGTTGKGFAGNKNYVIINNTGDCALTQVTYNNQTKNLVNGRMLIEGATDYTTYYMQADGASLNLDQAFAYVAEHGAGATLSTVNVQGANATITVGSAQSLNTLNILGGKSATVNGTGTLTLANLSLGDGSTLSLGENAHVTVTAKPTLSGRNITLATGSVLDLSGLTLNATLFGDIAGSVTGAGTVKLGTAGEMAFSGNQTTNLGTNVEIASGIKFNGHGNDSNGHTLNLGNGTGTVAGVKVNGDFGLESKMRVVVQQGSSLVVTGSLDMGHTQSGNPGFLDVNGGTLRVGHINFRDNTTLNTITLADATVEATQAGNLFASTGNASTVSATNVTLKATNVDWAWNRAIDFGGTLTVDAGSNTITLGAAGADFRVGKAIELISGTVAFAGNWEIGDIPHEGTTTYTGGATEGDVNGFASHVTSLQLVNMGTGTSIGSTSGAHFTIGGVTATLESTGLAKTSGEVDYATFHVMTGSENVSQGRLNSHDPVYSLADGTELVVDADLTGAKLTRESGSTGNATLNIQANNTYTSDGNVKNVTITGAGTYALKSGTSAMVDSLAQGENGWTGTVVITNAGNNRTIDEESLVNGTYSTLQMEGFNGWFGNNHWYGERNQNIKLVDYVNEGGSTVSAWKNGVAGLQKTYTETFSGTWSGTGTFERIGSNRMDYAYTGNISAWEGKFLMSGNGTTHLKFYGAANTVNAAIDRTNGTLNMEVGDGTNAFTATFNKEVGASKLEIKNAASATFEENLTLSDSLTLDGSATLKKGGSIGDSIDLGNGTLNISGGTTTVSGNLNVGKGDGKRSGYITVAQGATLTVNKLSTPWGFNSMTINGVFNATEQFSLNTGAHEYQITGTGTINTKELIIQDQTSKAIFSGGLKINIGDNGIKGNQPLELRDVTVGVLDGSNGWTANRAITLGDTTTGTTFNVGSGKTVTLGGVLSGSGKMNVTGGGTVTLNGANTFSGGTTVNGGTLKAGSLGTGDITVNGGTLELTSSITTTGALAVNGGTIKFAGAEMLTAGSLAVSEGVTFDLNNISATKAGTITLAIGTTEDGALTNVNVSCTLPSRFNFQNLRAQDNAWVIDLVYTGQALVWAGGEGNWSYSEEDLSWLTPGDEPVPTHFTDKDTAVFTAAGNPAVANITEAIATTNVEVQAGANVTLQAAIGAESASLTVAELEIGGTLSTSVDVAATAVLAQGADAAWNITAGTVTADSITVAQDGKLALSGTGMTVKTVSGLVEVADGFTLTLSQQIDSDQATDLAILNNGTVALALGSSQNVINMDAASTGTLEVTAGTISNQSALGANQTLKLNAGTIFAVKGGETAFASDIALAGNASMQLKDSANATFAGAVSGSGKTLSVSGGAANQTVTFTDTVTLGGLNVAGSGETIVFKGSGSSLGAIYAQSGAFTIQFSKADGGETASYTFDTFAMSPDDHAATRWLIVDAGVTVNGTGDTLSEHATIMNSWGISGGGLEVNGTLTTAGVIGMEAASTDYIKGSGTINAAGLNLSNGSTTYVQDGIKINITTDRGVYARNDTAAPAAIHLKNATLQAKDSDWTWANTNSVTVTLDDASTGTAFDAADGHTITLSKAMGGSGKLVKAGEGVVKLQGANTYSGGTAVNAGTLATTNDTALGTGNVDIAAAGTLEMRSNLTIAGDLTGSGAITYTGEADGTLSLTKQAEQNLEMDISAAGTGKLNLTLNGNSDYNFSGNVVVNNIAQSTNVTVSVLDEGDVTATGRVLTGHLVVGKTDAETDAVFTLSGADAQLYNDNGTEHKYTAVVQGYGTFAVVNGATQTLTKLNNSGQQFHGTLMAEGTGSILTIDSTLASDVTLLATDGGKMVLTSQVQVKKAAVDGGMFDLDATVETLAVTGEDSTLNIGTGSVENISLGGDLTANGDLTIFSGTKGTKVAAEAGKTMAVNGTANVDRRVKFHSSDTQDVEIAASRVTEPEQYALESANFDVTADKLELLDAAGATVDNKVDARIVVNATAEDGSLSLRHAVLDNLQEVHATTGDINFYDTEGSQMPVLKELSIGSGNEVSFYTNESSEETLQEATITVAGILLSDGSTETGLLKADDRESKLNANLVLGDATGTVGRAVLDVSAMEGEGGLWMGSSVTLNPMQVELSERDLELVSALGKNERYDLFNGVDQFLIADKEYTQLGMGDVWVDAATVFSNIDQTNKYYLFYTGESVNGGKGGQKGTVYLLQTPEPTTGTLSLLALCALAARRRRK